MLERVYAFTDEYGAFGWNIDNPSVSTHFIITAIIVKEGDLEEFRKINTKLYQSQDVDDKNKRIFNQ